MYSQVDRILDVLMTLPARDLDEVEQLVKNKKKHMQKWSSKHTNK
jgi:hypothetical protein